MPRESDARTAPMRSRVLPAIAGGERCPHGRGRHYGGMSRSLLVAVLLAASTSCTHPNEWVLKNPPETCARMCESWGLELAAVVGVGEQSREESSDGATACVCRVRGGGAEITEAELEAAGYAAIPPEIRARQAAATTQANRRTYQPAPASKR